MSDNQLKQRVFRKSIMIPAILVGLMLMIQGCLFTPTPAVTPPVPTVSNVQATKEPTAEPTKVQEEQATETPTVPTPDSSQQSASNILKLTLMDSATGQIMGYHDPIPDGDLINLKTLGANKLDIEASVAPSAFVKSVRFIVNNDESNAVVDNNEPYRLLEAYGTLNGWVASVGKQTITAIPYSGPDGTGVAGTGMTVSFDVVENEPVECKTTLAQLISKAAAGSTITVPPCIYREELEISKSITLDAEPGAEIRGSDIWPESEWKATGDTWVSTRKLDRYNTIKGVCWNDTKQCEWPEQVFMDGTPMEQVEENPEAGQFAVNRSRQVILGEDPAGHTIEVTTRLQWIVAKADNVTIRGFRMRHAAAGAQQGGIQLVRRSGWTIENNILSDTAGVVINMGKGNNTQIINNEVFRGGQEGIGGDGGTGNVLRGNRVYDNNTEKYNAFWEAAGIKLIGMKNLIIEDNEVFNNFAQGIWCDLDCDNVEIRNNRVHHNWFFGIAYEISERGKIYGNKIWQNGEQEGHWGLNLASASNTEVYDNIVAWNRNGIWVFSTRRSDVKDHPWNKITGNYVHDNIIILPDQDKNDPIQTYQHTGLEWTEDWEGGLLDPESNNRGENNLYYYPDPEGVDDRFYWGYESPFKLLEQFNKTPGEENARYMTTDEKDKALLDAGIPIWPELYPPQ